MYAEYFWQLSVQCQSKVIWCTSDFSYNRLPWISNIACRRGNGSKFGSPGKVFSLHTALLLFKYFRPFSEFPIFETNISQIRYWGRYHKRMFYWFWKFILTVIVFFIFFCTKDCMQVSKVLKLFWIQTAASMRIPIKRYMPAQWHLVQADRQRRLASYFVPYSTAILTICERLRVCLFVWSYVIR